MPVKRSIAIMLLLTALLLTNCAHTRIAPRALEHEAQRLAALAPRQLILSLSCPVDQILGHQYLLIALPFGRISVTDIETQLQNTLIREASQLGYALLFVHDGDPRATRITCHEVSLTAYDFLLFRRIVATIAIELSDNMRKDVATTITTSEAENRAFAFHGQLEQVLLKALNKIARSAIIKISETYDRRRGRT